MLLLVLPMKMLVLMPKAEATSRERCRVSSVSLLLDVRVVDGVCVRVCEEV